MFLPALKDLSQLPISCIKVQTEYVKGELNTSICRRVKALLLTLDSLCSMSGGHGGLNG